MKKGKEFIFPENVEKEYGVWRDYTLKDIGYLALTVGAGLAFVAVPPYGVYFTVFKIVLVIIAMTIVMAILTIKPISSRRNIRVRDYLKTRRQYNASQKLFFLKTKSDSRRNK
ncbi:conjugal transfer protein [Weissella cibaria]|uniref:conjugal transfer protein n=1 Tax=Weissella cibaria TaxID=137591 RepID=UPI001FF1696A|nr:conjugal transfer protein [Weissella cibaria]UOX35740.1 conjugal transfer protein [Weissella cibaria]